MSSVLVRGLILIMLALTVGACPVHTPLLRTPKSSCTKIEPVLGTFAAALGTGEGVQLVRVSGCDITLLPACVVPDGYTSPSPFSESASAIIRTDADLRMNLPFDADEVRKETEGWLFLAAEATREKHAKARPSSSALGAGCEGATHYVRQVWYGRLELVDINRSAKVRSTTGGSGSSAVVAFTLEPLDGVTVGACARGTVWDGRSCVAEAATTRCPLGTIDNDGSCKTAPVVQPKNPDLRSQAESLFDSLREAPTARRVALLDQLSKLYGDDERSGQAVVYSLMAQDPEIYEQCSQPGAAAARLEQPSFRREVGNVVADAPAPAQVPRSNQPPWCEQVARQLAAYAKLLTEAGQLDSASELNLRLIRDHSKSPSAAEAYRGAADKLCRDRRSDEAHRLYTYIRKNFPETQTAKALSAEPCPAAANEKK
jgi:hypothetical protein